MTQYRLLCTAVLALVLAGCGSTPVPDPEPQSGAGANDGQYDSGDTSGWDSENLGEGEEFGAGGRGELAMVVYFDFDQSELDAKYTDLLAKHANRLANSSRLNVRLEGHADERGSREYNIGLGERRSQAVRRVLLIQGASANQLSTVSFGEERPAEVGSDEEAYAMNRRVEIKYIN